MSNNSVYPQQAQEVAVTLYGFPQHIEALAQLVKRLGFTECRLNAVDEDEAYSMMDGLGILAKALAEAGYSPR